MQHTSHLYPNKKMSLENLQNKVLGRVLSLWCKSRSYPQIVQVSQKGIRKSCCLPKKASPSYAVVRVYAWVAERRYVYIHISGSISMESIALSRGIVISTSKALNFSEMASMLASSSACSLVDCSLSCLSSLNISDRCCSNSVVISSLSVLRFSPLLFVAPSLLSYYSLLASLYL